MFLKKCINCRQENENTHIIDPQTALLMIAWIIIIGVMIVAFVARMFVKLRRNRYAGNYHPNINTRKKRIRFVNRFRHLEGVGD